ncbi:NAD(P)/FAD-dependent oxidoreductase [Rhodococcus sp. IEGM 1374]|uniref:flavin-containing monooxygenase n=1 Tax=Rhodococcus sp. IEGM 1374 TaxID=3082221 RepID=UPI002955DE6E|nr:NAD(P)/FAD-dependent oxidoreductase [Rhodococcus sp. IEGM 1374]MDV7991918.1 NAD(P)/FAD-dependent oxidoreductase [Rhodococcus sp. IEGM 1374]
MSTDAATAAETVGGVDRDRLSRALTAANLPTLVAVLYQLTGDPKWLADPYRPTRSRGMDNNDTGGFDDAVADRIRAAALDAICAFYEGAPMAVTSPDSEHLVEMISVAVGEQVPPEFGVMVAEDMGFTAADTPVAAPNDLSVIVIGAGVSGMLAAIKLHEAGIRHTVLEKNSDVGGGWFENTYPGAGVDTPSHLYSYSFAPRAWSTHFGKRDEVWQYLSDVASEHDLRQRIRFDTEVATAEYDAQQQGWTVTTVDGEILTADVVITATGQLNRPKVPHIPGLESFDGPIFHTANWPADLDLTGKRVAIVGTGASAMQVLPAIASTVGHATVFQRSPQWVSSSDVYFTEMGDDANYLMDVVPLYRLWYRTRLAWNFNDRVHSSLQVDPEWEHPQRSINPANDAHRRVFTRYIERELEGRPDLIEKSLPDYPPFGKRMLLDNGWYAALKRDKVTLIADAVSSITANSVVAQNGSESEVDVVILATGFETHKLLTPIDVRGRSGESIRDIWGPEDAHAYLGITVPDFPNLFITCGPGTVLGHGGSYITIAECQVRYIVDVLIDMVDKRIGAIECKADVEAEYVRKHDEAHAKMIWSHGGMDNWYRNDAGRVVSTLPWRIVDYWEMTRRADLDDFVTEPRLDEAR